MVDSEWKDGQYMNVVKVGNININAINNDHHILPYTWNYFAQND